MPSTPPDAGFESLPEEEPIFRPPRIDPGTRNAWIAVGVAALVVGAGVVGFAYHDGVLGRPGGPPTTTLGLSAPTYGTILCQTDGEVYDLTYFPIAWIAGSTPVTTAQFGLSILTLHNATVLPNGSAPMPAPNLPCTAPEPTVWYAELYVGDLGTVATFPLPGSGDATEWSNATTAPVSLSASMDFILITDGDFTGSGDHLTTFDTGVTSVSLAGNTTFPAYHHP